MGELSLSGRAGDAMDFYKNIFMNAAEGIYQSTVEGEFIEVNPAMARMFGCRDPDEFKRIYADVARDFYVEPDAREKITDALARHDWVTGFETLGKRKDGETFWFRESARAVRDETGRIVGYEGFVEDITEKKVAEEELRKAYAALQDTKSRVDVASRAKSTFLTNMTHELRTPLNAIIGFASLLRDTRLLVREPENCADYGADIEDNARYLLDLVNDMLDLAKSEAGKLDLYLEHLDVAALLADCMRVVRPKAHGRTVELCMGDMPDDCTVEADARRLKQVFVNLLSNAVKFTPEGGRVTLDVSADTAANVLVVHVRDTGIGMAEDDVTRAMQPFQQVDGALDRHHGGTGLGLPLAKDLVDLHGGRLSIESARGAGTTARVELPKREVRTP